ncbi:E3 ubiquitin-protein ligase MIB2-like isoform X2 [Mercenaria mercenaria]|uniref:E3 ubiquitin-protein ligase MIB2-like isoform X2 n=1 Tax=Mercenaria mercenaria TaxID=6596 RepID=UPI00234E44B2|nr:E3 ubiquitin-protein ligase MIB2-like isoform X2 [Mercenaria mercenaria]
MKPGIRVIRGPDWRLGDQDGGPGYLGTVVNIFPNNSVLVKWDIGTETVCRAGQDRAFDLRLYDNAQIGTHQNGWYCDGEYSTERDGKKPTIHGFKWKCLVCKDTDFCTDCYMSDMKGFQQQCADTNHPFVRYMTPRSLVVRVPPRKRSKKIPLYGIFPGAEVTKIVSSSSDNEQLGVVKELIDLQPDAYRSAVKVEWVGATQKKTDEGEPDWPIYRIGADGKVELKLITPASPGTVYVDHLPVLDLTMPVDIEFNVGDRVRVDLNLDTYKPLLTEYGGWIPDLERVLGEEGTVMEVKDTNRRIVSVRYESLGITVRAMYMNVLTKISTISAGDTVKIIQDQNKMKKLQVGHGGWQQAFVSILGATGRVVRVSDSKDAIVKVAGETFVLNQSCLVLQQHAEEVAPVSSDADSLKRSFKGSFRRSASVSVPEAARRTIRADISVGVGTRVVRGPDWSPDFQDQDGGEGHVGSVVEICGLKDNGMYPKQCVVVQWDNGEKNVYRAGYEKAYDLRIYDNAGIGVKHNVKCAGCDIDTVFGMLWTCSECPDVNLCTECYFNDKHEINHQFIRHDTVDRSEGMQVPKRGISRTLPAMGIFEKCKVRRGPDWRWHNQDGGEDKYGEVIAIVNFSPDTDRDAAEVTWENGYTNVYRLGYKGRHDVVCIKPVNGGKFYKDHLPILKLDLEVKPPEASAAKKTPTKPQVDDSVDKEAARFKEGDKVRIEIDIDVLKMIEDNRGAWNDHMTECIGKTGVVIVSKGNDITVDFESAGRWTFHESVLNKVREFVPGEVVKVNDSVDHVRMLQTDRGGWNELMVKVIGRKGTVEEIDEDGDVQVSFGDYTWTFNPECLGPGDGKADHIGYKDDDPGLKPPVVKEQRKEPETDEEKMEDLFEMIITGETEKVNRIIQKEPQLMLMDLQGKFAVHLACKNGQIDVLKAMFKCASKEALLEISDSEEKITPLLAAVSGEQIDMVKFLVEEGANKKAVNHNKQGAVQMAVACKNVALLKVLRDLEFDVNQKDLLKQSPVVDAIVQGNEEIIDILLDWPDLDIQFTDSIGFSPFFLACRKGNLKAVQKILQKRMMEIKERKEQDGYTGLHLAAFNGNKDVVEFLIKQPMVEIDCLTKEERTPLHLACAEGFFDIVTVLLDGGANITICDASKKNSLHIYLEGAGAKDTEQVADFTRMVEYLIDNGVSADGLDEAEKRPAEYVSERMNETYQSIVAKRFGQDNIDKENERSQNKGPSSLPKTGSVREEPDTSRMARSAIGRGQRSEEISGANSGPPRIEDMRGVPVGLGQGQSRDKTVEEQEKAQGDDIDGEESQNDPEICESCEDEPIRFKMEPCGHFLCADCIPRKKQKKKTCAVCAETALEVVEIRH